MKVLRHLQRSARVSDRLWYGRLLCEWLNARPNGVAQKRIASLLENMRAVGEAAKPKEKSTTAICFVRGVGGAPSSPMLKAIWREIRSYPGLLMVAISSDRWGVRMGLDWECAKPASVSQTEEQARSGRLPRRSAFGLLLMLAKAGGLESIRRCDRCGKWFIAKRRWQAFCGVKCQRSEFRDSEEWRAHRREYMREYRQREREGNPSRMKVRREGTP